MSIRKQNLTTASICQHIDDLHLTINLKQVKTTLETAGGRIVCARCAAKSKRTGEQCKAPAIREKSKCRFHGGLSTGPRSQAGRNRCAQAKLVHGRETKEMRQNHKDVMAQLKLYAQILGVQWRMN